MDRYIERLKRAEPEVREWYRDKMGLEFPEISYVCVPDSVLKKSDSFYSHSNFVVNMGASPDEWYQDYIRRGFRRAARKVVPKHKRGLENVERMEITGEYCDEVADALFGCILKSSRDAWKKNSELVRFLRNIHEYSIGVLPISTSPKNILSALVHEYFHIAQKIKGFNRRYPLSKEGTAVCVQRAFGSVPKPTRSQEREFERCLRKSRIASSYTNLMGLGLLATFEVLDRMKIRNLLNGHVYRRVDRLTVQNYVEDFIGGFLGMEMFNDSFNTGK